MANYFTGKTVAYSTRSEMQVKSHHSEVQLRCAVGQSVMAICCVMSLADELNKQRPAFPTVIILRSVMPILSLVAASVALSAVSAEALDVDSVRRPSVPSILQGPFPTFGGIATRIVIGNNPDGQKGFNDRKTKNPISLLVDVGGYGAPSFSGLSVPEAITGAMNIPATANSQNHASGVSGYARSASSEVGAVGLYGQGDAVGAAGVNTPAWGVNTRTQDNGIKTNGLWGAEIDINVTAAGSFARGVDIVGGSTQQPDLASPGLIVQTPGIFYKGTARAVRWGRGVLVDDESAFAAVEVGSALANAASGSMPITFMYRDAGNARAEAFRLYSSNNNGTIEITAPNSLLKLRGDVNGRNLDTVTVYGGNTGIGAGAPALPAYPLDVFGSARFTGNVGFGGARPIGKQQLAAALPTDGSASNAELAAAYNSLRKALVNLGLAQ
jgi:hypothetical protein